ncbi:MAG TPA: ABC transporter permease [Vicinamibacterales bacterium]
MALPFSYNARNVLVRWKVTLLAIGGIGLVVAVFIFLVAMSAGFRLALRATGSPENAILIQKGSNAELTSGLSREDAQKVIVDDRVARDAQGRPLASPEVVIVGVMMRKDPPVDVNVTIRGVSQMAFQVRSGVRIVEGRNFTPGLNEIIVGRKLQERMQRANVGDVLRLQKRDWNIVGVFEAEGSGFESEVWGDVDVIAQAFNRSGSYQSVTMRLKDPSTLEAFARQVDNDPALQADLKQERAFYEAQSEQLATGILVLAAFVGIVMGIGAVFGAMNTMYAIVSARTREIGTLRALGFRRWSVLVSFVAESILLALAGGVLGCLLALPFNGLTTATGGANFSEVAFAFRITPGALVAGLVFALLMGLAGGLFPAWRAAKLPITSALREA